MTIPGPLKMTLPLGLIFIIAIKKQFSFGRGMREHSIRKCRLSMSPNQGMSNRSAEWLGFLAGHSGKLSHPHNPGKMPGYPWKIRCENTE